MKSVLFVCIENACRSQMAEGFAKASGKDFMEVYSAGSRPSGQIDPTAIKVMAELGIDISRQSSKGFLNLPVKHFDYAITLGCGDQCPFVPAERRIDWKILDPKNKDLNFFRQVRNDIGREVKAFLQYVKRG
jgi:arsenate reductase (thioredoxin)